MVGHLVRQRVQPGGVEVADDHLRPLGEEAQHRRLADPAGPAGDDGDLCRSRRSVRRSGPALQLGEDLGGEQAHAGLGLVERDAAEAERRRRLERADQLPPLR